MTTIAQRPSIARMSDCKFLTGTRPTYTDRLRAALLLATATHDPDAAVRFRSRLVELWLTDAGVIPARVESPYGLAEVLEWIAAAEAAVMTR